MLIAVAVFFSVSYWLISRVEAAKWQKFIREKVDAALQHGGGTALSLVAFLAVYREGAETALFYQALLNEGTAFVLPILAGVVVGGAMLAVIFTLFWKYGIKIPLRPFFAVTSVLLYYMAFVFMGKGIRELQEGGVVPHHGASRLAARGRDGNLPQRGDAARAAAAAGVVRVRAAEDLLAVAVRGAADGADGWRCDAADSRAS